MNLQINFCFICLKEDESLQGLLENQINNETNYARLTSLIPEMVRKITILVIYLQM